MVLILKKVSRKCPSCSEKIYHKNIDTLDQLLFKKTLCTKCCNFNRGLDLSIDEIRNLRKEYDEKYSKYIVSDSNNVFIRKCPTCFEDVIHTNYEGLHNSFVQNRMCKKCLGIKQSEQYKGVGNPYYGKKHSDSVRKKLSDSWTNPTEGRQKQLDHFQSDEYKIKFRNNVKFFFDDNPIKNSNFLGYWTEKYGVDEANRRWKQYIERTTAASSGKNNPMYGKPSPQGSGNGWKGWYITNQNEKIFFRSITELSYFINIIERFSLDWTTGESQKYKIQYTDYEGKIRNYFPDYVIANKYIVECKPKRLWDSANVKSKIGAAIEYCKNNDMVYKIRDCRKTDLLHLFDLYNNERIIPQNDKYRIKFETYFKKYLGE